MSALIKKPEATSDVAEWSNNPEQNKIGKQTSFLSLPSPHRKPRSPKSAIFLSLVWRGRFSGWGSGWIFNIVLSNIEVNLSVVCIAMWMTKHEQRLWQELKTAVLVCNARNLLAVASHRQFSRPHIEAGNWWEKTRTRSQGVRHFFFFFSRKEHSQMSDNDKAYCFNNGALTFTFAYLSLFGLSAEY